MAVRPRGDRFQADVTHGGRRCRETFATQAAGVAWEGAALAALMRGEEPPPPECVAEAGATLQHVYDRTLALDWADVRDLATVTKRAKAVLNHFGRTCAVNSINAKGVSDFIVALRGKGNSAGTVNRKIAALSKMLRRAELDGFILRRPVIQRAKEGKGRLRFLSETEEAAQLAALRAKGLHLEADLALFLVDTGARLNEGRLIEWPAITATHATFWKTKGDRPRTVPLTARVRAMLDARCLGRTNGSTGPFDTIVEGTMRVHWNAARDKLGLGDDVVIHTLRHTCASRLVQKGVGLKVVQEWMGHASIQVTMRYAHLRADSLDLALAALEGTVILPVSPAPAAPAPVTETVTAVSEEPVSFSLTPTAVAA